jgi:hypothetical protein
MLQSQLDAGAAAAEVRRTRERAQKRLQTLTKELDWRVAKAYVDLIDEDDLDLHNLKRKEGDVEVMKMVGTSARSVLESAAIERYLDDDEWEAQQRREGRNPRISPFPFRTSAVKR